MATYVRIDDRPWYPTNREDTEACAVVVNLAYVHSVATSAYSFGAHFTYLYMHELVVSEVTVIWPWVGRDWWGENVGLSLVRREHVVP